MNIVQFNPAATIGSASSYVSTQRKIQSRFGDGCTCAVPAESTVPAECAVSTTSSNSSGMMDAAMASMPIDPWSAIAIGIGSAFTSFLSLVLFHKAGAAEASK